MNHTQFAVACALALGMLSPGALAHAGDALGRFRGEYPKAEAALRQRLLKDGVGHATETLTRRRPNDTDLVYIKRFTYYVLGNRLRLDEETVQDPSRAVLAAMKPPRPLPPVNFSRVYTGERTFNVNQAQPGAPFLLEGVSDTRGKGIAFLMNRMTEAPFRFANEAIAEFAGDNPTIRLKSGSETREDGRTLIKVEFGRMYKGEEVSQGWFQLDPDWGWVLHSWHTENPKSGITETGRINYRIDASNEPLPTSVVREGMNSKSGLASTTTLELGDFQPGAAKPSDFEFAAFGLPEVGKPIGTSNQAQAAWWLFGAAGAALVLAIALRYAMTRTARA